MKTILAIALLAAPVPSLADDFGLLGTWHGRLNINTPPLPASASRAARMRQAQELREVRRGSLVLQMYRDHRYTIHTLGLPSFGPVDSHGIWSKRGSVLSLIPTGTSRTNAFTVAPGERRLTASAAFGPTTAQFVFTR